MSRQQFDQTGPLLVIGAGLGRTGTSSLKRALEMLYGQPCYHMYEVIVNHPEHIQDWFEIFKAVEKSPSSPLPVDRVKNIFHGYRAATDYPVCSLYSKLLKIYPEAKVILTIRNKYEWLESYRSTICPIDKTPMHAMYRRLVMNLSYGWRFGEMAASAMNVTLGNELNDDQILLAAFEAWNEQVKSTVPSEKLLVFDVKEGWKPLCAFLDFPVPSIPFPHLNDREAHLALIAGIVRRGKAKLLIGIVTLGALVAIGVLYMYPPR